MFNPLVLKKSNKILLICAVLSLTCSFTVNAQKLPFKEKIRAKILLIAMNFTSKETTYKIASRIMCRDTTILHEIPSNLVKSSTNFIRTADQPTLAVLTITDARRSAYFNQTGLSCNYLAFVNRQSLLVFDGQLSDTFKVVEYELYQVVKSKSDYTIVHFINNGKADLNSIPRSYSLYVPVTANQPRVVFAASRFRLFFNILFKF
jgi:hypothetical protein